MSNRYTRKHKCNTKTQDIHKCVIRHNYRFDATYKYQQKGGRTYQETIASCKINITEYNSSDDNCTIIINGGISAKPCFVLFYNKCSKSIHVQELSRGSTQKCMECTNIKDNEDIAEKMMHVIMGIAMKKKVKTVVFADDSARVCKAAGNKTFQLVNMYFLAYGKTWYESKMPGMIPDIDLTTDRQLVQTNSWQDIVAALIKRNEYDAFTSSLTEPIPSSIDISAPGSAMTVFRWLKETGQCVPFCNHMTAFISGSNMTNLFGLTWTAHLT